MRSRALTETLPRPDVSLIVEEYRCLSHSISKTIGASASHKLWRMRALGHGKDATESIPSATASPAAYSPIERALRSVTFEVFTDSGLVGLKSATVGTQVAIKENGKQVFPDSGAKGKMHDDWKREWKFRSLYPGVGLVRPGEAWVAGTIPTDVPSQAGDAVAFLQTRVLGDGKLHTMHEIQVGNLRHPAVLTKQWPNGCFEVTAFKQDERGFFHLIEFPTMHKSDIFLTATGENIDLHEIVASLEVFRSNPQVPMVLLEGNEFLRYLGRASPKPSAGTPRRILVDCPKPLIPQNQAYAAKNVLMQNTMGIVQQEKPVEINLSPMEWEHFLSGEVRRGDTTATRLRRCWTVQLGPFATHTLRLEKKSHVNSVMSLYVDEEILAECTSLDLQETLGSPDIWRCKFQFIGERIMDFNVHEETKDGWPLDSKSVITKPTLYRHEVEIVYQHRAIDNLVDAQMKVDGVPFASLPSVLPAERPDTPQLSIVPRALEVQFGIKIPRKVGAQDTRGIARQIGSNVVQQAGGWTAIGEAATTTAAEVGANLTQLGLSAWEMMFLQKGVEASNNPTSPTSGYDLQEHDPKYLPVQMMPSRVQPVRLMQNQGYMDSGISRISM